MSPVIRCGVGVFFLLGSLSIGAFDLVESLSSNAVKTTEKAVLSGPFSSALKNKTRLADMGRAVKRSMQAHPVVTGGIMAVGGVMGLVGVSYCIMRAVESAKEDYVSRPDALVLPLVRQEHSYVAGEQGVGSGNEQVPGLPSERVEVPEIVDRPVIEVDQEVVINPPVNSSQSMALVAVPQKFDRDSVLKLYKKFQEYCLKEQQIKVTQIEKPDVIEIKYKPSVIFGRASNSSPYGLFRRNLVVPKGFVKELFESAPYLKKYVPNYGLVLPPQGFMYASSHKVGVDEGIQKKETEDRSAYCHLKKKGAGEVSICAVFDGHGGSSVAEVLREQFVPALAKEFLKESILHESGSVEWINDFLKRAFSECDKEIRRCADWNGVGSTASLVLVWGSWVIVATVGDSRVLVGFKDRKKKVWESSDHSFSCKGEELRVEREGGDIVECSGEERLVCGDNMLNLTRSLGDFLSNGTKPKGLSSVPGISIFRRDEIDFVCAASDGFWGPFDWDFKAPEDLDKMIAILRGDVHTDVKLPEQCELLVETSVELQKYYNMDSSDEDSDGEDLAGEVIENSGPCDHDDITLCILKFAPGL